MTLAACGGGSDAEPAADGSAAAGDAGSEAGVVAEAGAGAGCGCAATEACVKVTVTLDAASGELPWKLWPEQKLGEGRLFAGAFATGGSGTVAKFVDDVKLSSGFTRQTLALCLTPSANTRAFCFLDDKADGELKEPSAQLTGSGNYRDTCSMERYIALTLSASATQEVTCQLANSCD